MSCKGRPFWGYLLVSVFIICVDQITKQIAHDYLHEQPSIEVFPFLQWVMVFNHGAAFGFLNDSNGWQHFLFGGLAVGMSIIILICLYHTYRSNVILSLGLACMLGGAIGNLIDRLFNQYVIDFILLHYNTWYFPAFNMADIAITCGAILLILDSVRSRNQKSSL